MLPLLSGPVNLRSSSRVELGNRVSSSLPYDKIQKDQGPTTLLKTSWVAKSTIFLFLSLSNGYVGFSLSFWEYQQRPTLDAMSLFGTGHWTDRSFYV